MRKARSALQLKPRLLSVWINLQAHTSIPVDAILLTYLDSILATQCECWQP